MPMKPGISYDNPYTSAIARPKMKILYTALFSDNYSDNPLGRNAMRYISIDKVFILYITSHAESFSCQGDSGAIRFYEEIF